MRDSPVPAGAAAVGGVIGGVVGAALVGGGILGYAALAMHQCKGSGCEGPGALIGVAPLGAIAGGGVGVCAGAIGGFALATSGHPDEP